MLGPACTSASRKAHGQGCRVECAPSDNYYKSMDPLRRPDTNPAPSSMRASESHRPTWQAFPYGSQCWGDHPTSVPSCGLCRASSRSPSAFKSPRRTNLYSRVGRPLTIWSTGPANGGRHAVSRELLEPLPDPLVATQVSRNAVSHTCREEPRSLRIRHARRPHAGQGEVVRSEGSAWPSTWSNTTYRSASVTLVLSCRARDSDPSGGEGPRIPSDRRDAAATRSTVSASTSRGWTDRLRR
jgi:hypothetical protein